MANFFPKFLRSQNYIAFCKSTRSSRSSPSVYSELFGSLPQVKFFTSTGTVSGFNGMAVANERKYYMVGGKGGVGKTSCAASLAVKFANYGHPTIVVSTDPAHSLSDSFAQDLTGGSLVPVQGLDSQLYALEINPEKAKEEWCKASKAGGGAGAKNLMNSFGLGMLSDQLGDLNFEDLLGAAPPGMDEAIAISKILQFVEAKEYNMFTRIVFDTAPTGHTLRLLSLPDFMDTSVGKIIKLKKKLALATSAIKYMFGKEGQKETGLEADDKLEQLKERMTKLQDLFRNPNTTEFIIVAIPTVMAISEASRLCSSLRKENVPVERLVLNQILPASASECRFCAVKRKDQQSAIEKLENDAELGSLKLIQAPLVDVEIRGLPALKYFGDMIWR